MAACASNVVTAMGVVLLATTGRASVVPGTATKPNVAEGFMWGAATAAPQIEGFPDADGRQPSIWDEGSKPEYHHIANGDDMTVADMDYIYFESKTLPLLIESGMSHYRMSVSWTRVLRNQTLEAPAGIENPAGIAHYKRQLELLALNGIEPLVTMFHWDTPLSLEVQYGGFLNSSVIPLLFGEYAKTLLRHYGELVRYWVTVNEPLTVASGGYFGGGSKAPFRCSNRARCAAGDDSREPYIAGHTMVLMHAHAFRAFRTWKEESIDREGVELTMSLNVNGVCVPYDADSEADLAAATRCMEWQVGWYFDPVFFGDYPASMRSRLGARLPTFTAEEKELVYGSHTGLFGMNYYSSIYVKDAPDACGACNAGESSCGWGSCDGGFLFSHDKDGEFIGEKCKANQWLYSYPEGFRVFLNWVSNRYEGSPKIRIVVTENGWGDPGAQPLRDLLHDIDRCNYYRGHLQALSLARHVDGVDIIGFFAWSLMDNFEWEDGYQTRFGLTHVDYGTQQRTPKHTFRWLMSHAFPLAQLPEDGAFPACDATAPAVLYA